MSDNPFEEYANRLQEQLPEDPSAEAILDAAEDDPAIAESARRIAAVLHAVEGREAEALAYLLTSSQVATGTGETTDHVLDYMQALAVAGEQL